MYAVVGFYKFTYTWFLKFIEMQMLWLLGIIIRKLLDFAYWVSFLPQK